MMNDGHRIRHRCLWNDVMKEFNEKCVFKYSTGEKPEQVGKQVMGRWYYFELPANEEYIYACTQMGLWKGRYDDLWRAVGSKIRFIHESYNIRLEHSRTLIHQPSSFLDHLQEDRLFDQKKMLNMLK